MELNSVEWMIVEKKVSSFFQPRDYVLLSLSGGSDSLFLFHILLLIKKKWPQFQFDVFHLNHFIAGNERFALDSSHFVVNLCDQYKIPCYAYVLPVERVQKTKKISAEEAGRLLRYGLLDHLQRMNAYQWVAIGHQEEDQVETLLMRLFKGTGIRGFLGIQETRHYFIRPLLAISKTLILRLLNEGQIQYCEDPTNQESHYLRNQIRNILHPVLRSIFGKYDHKLLQFRDLLQEREIVFQQSIPEWKKRESFFVEMNLNDINFFSEGELLGDLLLKGLRMLRKDLYVHFSIIQQMKQSLLKRKSQKNREYKMIYQKKGMQCFLSMDQVVWLDRSRLQDFKKQLIFQQEEESIYQYGKIKFQTTLPHCFIQDLDSQSVLDFLPRKKVSQFLQEQRIHLFLRPFFKGIFQNQRLIGLLEPFGLGNFIHKDFVFAMFLSQK